MMDGAHLQFISKWDGVGSRWNGCVRISSGFVKRKHLVIYYYFFSNTILLFQPVIDEIYCCNYFCNYWWGGGWCIFLKSWARTVSVVKYIGTLLHMFFLIEGKIWIWAGWGLISYRGNHLRHETTACLINKYWNGCKYMSGVKSVMHEITKSNFAEWCI